MKNNKVVLAIYCRKGGLPLLKKINNKILLYLKSLKLSDPIRINSIDKNTLIITSNDILGCIKFYLDIINEIILSELNIKANTISFIGEKDEILNFIENAKNNFNKLGKVFVIDENSCHALSVSY